MKEQTDQLAIALFSEIFMADQLARSRLAKVLPKGMELSHFSVLHHLARGGVEKSPAELARAFNVTRGAMTNTISKLEWAGYVHVRPDWDDARRKHISISPAGTKARDAALEAIAPILAEAVKAIGPDRVKHALPVLRELRTRFSDEGKW
ncbi:MAG: MarR family transcriptional regulator [Paracoccaceae bacterium]|nr:MarR family transcriptional regulator [Paracoccaceae bacterium]